MCKLRLCSNASKLYCYTSSRANSMQLIHMMHLFVEHLFAQSWLKKRLTSNCLVLTTWILVWNSISFRATSSHFFLIVFTYFQLESSDPFVLVHSVVFAGRGWTILDFCLSCLHLKIFISIHLGKINGIAFVSFQACTNILWHRLCEQVSSTLSIDKRIVWHIQPFFGYISL